MTINKEKLKIGFIIVLISIFLTIILNFFSGYKDQLKDYLLNNIKSYTIIDYTKKEKILSILSMYYKEYVVATNNNDKDKIKKYINKHYNNIDINNIHDPLVKQFVLECRGE